MSWFAQRTPSLRLLGSTGVRDRLLRIPCCKSIISCTGLRNIYIEILQDPAPSSCLWTYLKHVESIAWLSDLVLVPGSLPSASLLGAPCTAVSDCTGALRVPFSRFWGFICSLNVASFNTYSSWKTMIPFAQGHSVKYTALRNS